MIFGIGWLFYAVSVPYLNGVKASSEAMEFQSKLYEWMDEKVQSGNLERSDVEELFPDGYGSFEMSATNSEEDFTQMMRRISVMSAPSQFLGFMAFFAGLAGLISCFIMKPKKVEGRE